MTIGESAGAAEIERTVDMPVSHAAAEQHEPTEAEGKEILVKELAKPEDADSYVRERDLQDRERAGHKTNDSDKRERAERARQAIELQDEQARLRGEVPAEPQPSPEDVARERDATERRLRAEGAFLSRAQEVAKQFDDWGDRAITLRDNPLRDDITELLVHSERGPHVAYMLGSSDQAIAAINDLPLHEAAKWIGKLEMHAERYLEDRAAQKSKAEAEQYLRPDGRPRFQTRAPPPMTQLRGGASPPRDLGTLAKSDDVSDYVAERTKQDRARAR